ncbi:MAG: hypothetical protein MI861_08235 [Pirellulales bacterium]|nr:hypothetical protein [Pirellulales bacterium]
MMYALLIRHAGCLLIAFTCLFALGCLERSTVVKVKRDGSGLVHFRSHEQDTTLTFGKRKVKVDDKSKLPAEQTLRQVARSMGKGVTLKSAKESKNRHGWEGYELIFEFEDINQLVLVDVIGDLEEEDDAESTSRDKPDDRNQEMSAETEYRFSMKDGKLQIHSSITQADSDRSGPPSDTDGAADPFAKQGSKSPSPAEMAMIKASSQWLRDARIGIFVEIDGEIESSDARHRDGNLITLAEINLGEVLGNTEALQKLQALEAHQGTAGYREKAQKLADQIAGLNLDASETITVTME